jgi:3',5'-cyclic AMP phosphodiesterase CpdA
MKHRVPVLVFLFSITFLVINPLSNAETVRFAVLGDTQGSGGTLVSDAFPKIVKDVLAADPKVQFVIVVGDLVHGTNSYAHLLEQFSQWKDYAKPWYESDFYGLKVYVLPGNHDQHNYMNAQTAWQESFPYLPDNGPSDDKLMTYSFDVGPCHLVCVNTSDQGLVRNHTVDVKWLRRDLESSDKPIKLVFGHEPAYRATSTAVVGLDCQNELRDEFWQILSEHGVKAYFCGHDHGYDRWIKDNIHQITTGGGGGYYFYHYTIVEADENDVTVSIYTEPDNSLYEQFKLSDTSNAADEDRTVNDSSFWPYNTASCSWASMYIIVMILLGCTWISNMIKPDGLNTQIDRF